MSVIIAIRWARSDDQDPVRHSPNHARAAHRHHDLYQSQNLESTEFSAGRSIYSKLMKSTVEVWPTSTLVASNNNPSRKSRARACFVRFLNALHKRTNRERKGRLQLGPFTITTVPNPLPGVSHSFLTTINETLQLRTGAIRAHIYRDIFGFTTGPAEIDLEAIGFSRPIPTSTEAQALQLLVNRATAHTI
jgi:hypothetical protein